MTDPEPVEPANTVRLVTLGSAKLLAAAPGIPASTILRPGKPLALLIYLASSPARTSSREHLINLLWADVDPDRGLRTLRQTIFQLRQLLGESSIASSGRELCLDLKLQCDRDDFLAAVASGDNNSAVSLYTGFFLSDFGVPGGAEFEHWADRERDRLHAAYVRTAESVIRDRLDHAQYDMAIREARRLRDFDRDREASWRILLEALVSSGDQVSSLTEAEELQRFLEAEDREPESLTRSAITRAKRLQPAAQHDDVSTARLVADLTGRDREFSRLTSLWATVKSGHFRHAHITASPGIGKTRLMRDVYTRLRASGARAVWITAFAGDRRLAFALASDIVGKAANLSGASGISTAAASSLIALNPKLSSSFAAPQGRAVGDEAFRRRVHAVTELFEALADETPIAVFIDDMHWSDTVSRQLLKSSFSRIGDCRIFLVTSARTVPDGSLNLPATEAITLDPLDEHQVGQLITSFGSFADPHSATAFIHAVHEHTGGSPLLVLENLHLAIERGLLELRDGEWIMPHTAALIESISRGDVLEQRLRKLDDRLFRILLLLAIAEEPVSASLIAKALGMEQPVLETHLLTLEQQALVASEKDHWRCSHDSIADAILRLAPPHDRTSMHSAIGIALAETDIADVRHARATIRHLQAAERNADVEAVFGRFVTGARNAGDMRSNIQLAAAVLGEAAPTDAASRLAASLPLRQRFESSVISRIAGIVVVLGAAVLLALWNQSTKPSQLAIITQPLAGNSLIVPPPVVEIDDQRGRRVRGWTDSVSVEPAPGSGPITGTLKVAAVDGRAEFRDLSVTREGPVQLLFKAKGLKQVLAHRINAETNIPTLRLVSGVVNGQTIGPEHRSVAVRPGASITGDVMLEYSSYWGSASVILGAVAMWGDRTKNFLDLAPLFTPAEHQPRRAHITFTAPQTYGIYYIVFAFDAEGNVEDFVSGTNWRLPAPIWNDGNDIADWNQAQIAQAKTRGWVQTTFVQIDNRTGKPVVAGHPIASTVIDVIVK